MNRFAAAVLLLALPLQVWALTPPFTPHPGLDFTMSPEAITKDCKDAKSRAESAVAIIVTLPPPTRTFGNTPEALENAGWDLQDAAAAMQFLNYVSPTEAVRKAAHECETLLEKFGVETFTRPDLYNALLDYASQKEKLSGERAKLLEKQQRDFKRNGLALPVQSRARVKAIKERLVEIELGFQKNLNEVKDYLPVTKEELAGLPEDYVSGLQKEGERYKVTVDYPDYFPFMNNGKNSKARQLLEKLYNNRAAQTNLTILREVLDLRQEAAALLGYNSHAHYVLEERMARKPSAVKAFLKRMDKRLKAQARRELETLVALKREQEGAASDGVLHAWDWRFYDNLLKKTRYQVDDEKIKEYFPVDVVTGGMLEVYQKLLGVEFRENTNALLWHPDVKLFEVRDAPGGRVDPAAKPIGYFYMDLYPRDGKYKHAAAFTLIKGRELVAGGYQAPVSAMVANFPKPTPTAPSLLRHQDVETFFHEFGHIMHQTLTRARYGRFSGSSVARDFVEAPSQMLENWVWEPEVLTLLSGHHEDRTQKLPKDLLDKMIAAKNVNAGLVYLRQVFFATIDQRYHADGVADTTAEYERLMEKTCLIPMSEGTHPEASFGHLMGYDSGYYGYLWSEVFAQDMFSRFEDEGVMSPAMGRRYRELILEPGSGPEEAETLRQFLGREPNEDAFLRNIGLLPKRKRATP